MGHSKNSSKREVYSNSTLPQETRKTQNTPTLDPLTRTQFYLDSKKKLTHLELKVVTKSNNPLIL